jgi:tyrosyl-tRNA synthetase
VKESKGSASSAWEALTAGAVEIVDREHLRTRIERGERLRVKLGLDPTRPDLHLGHTVVLRAMRRFEDAGHTGVLIVGDWTARIGDPSGQNVTRPQLTREQVDAAAETYLNQLWKILDEGRTEVRYQSEWFDRMKLDDVVHLLGQSTVARMLAREDFARRYREGRPIGLHELLYPLLQGYDSVAVRADLELGGTDQTFNLLVGRDLQQAAGQPAQDVMTLPLLQGLDGVQKMSQSLDNYIGIDEPPRDMYWKAMAIPDSLIVRYLELATTATPEEVAAARGGLEGGANPKDLKKDLARRIVALYHGPQAAAEAEATFLKAPDLPQKTVPPGRQRLDSLFLLAGLASSKSEVRRLVEQKGLAVDDRLVTSPEEEVEVRSGMVLRRGKHQSVALRVQ